MTLRAFDAANPNISIPAMVQQGGIVAPVYIVGSPGGFPHVDRARVAALRQAGIAPLPNWERAAGFFLTCTLAEARAAGAEALAAARACRFPDDGTIRIPFSIDAQVPVSRYAEMGDKIHEAGRGLEGAFQPMLYAQSGLIEYVARNGQAPGKHWLMASTWGQAYKADSQNVCLVQSHDAAGNWINSPIPGTDINTVTDPHAIGAWWPDGSPYGADMPTVEEIWNHPIADPDDKTGQSKPQADSWLVYANKKAGNALAAAKTAQSSTDALAAQVKALQAQVAALQLGGLDAAALAKALAPELAAHIDIAAK